MRAGRGCQGVGPAPKAEALRAAPGPPAWREVRGGVSCEEAHTGALLHGRTIFVENRFRHAIESRKK